MILRNNLGQTIDTVVVAARHAWPEYLKYSAYICQPSRPIASVQYIGFYHAGVIQPIIAKVKSDHPRVSLTPELFDGAVKRIIERILEDHAEGRQRGQVNDIYRLSASDDLDTIRLAKSIPNDKRNASGKRLAFTQNQFYCSLADLQSVARLPDSEGFTSHLSRISQ